MIHTRVEAEALVRFAKTAGLRARVSLSEGGRVAANATGGVGAPSAHGMSSSYP